MKKIITVLFTIIMTSFFAFGQDNNEKLYQSIIKGDTLIVSQLLKDNANPNYIKTVGPWMKVNMLITAVNNNNIDIVKILIANKVDINWRDGFNTTALMYAASKGNKEIIVTLLDNGADINDNDGNGNSVLSAAKESKNKEVIKFIQDKLKDKK
jgi:ankyrin repeat protein